MISESPGNNTDPFGSLLFWPQLNAWVLFEMHLLRAVLSNSSLHLSMLLPQQWKVS